MKQKITTITVSDSRIPLKNYRAFWKNVDQLSDCNSKVREILIRRKGPKDIPILRIDNISKSYLFKIQDHNGEVILDHPEPEEWKNNTWKSQVYLWISCLINDSHKLHYKEGNCIEFMYVALWIENPFINENPRRINQSVFTVQSIPHQIIKTVEFDLWDVIMLAEESNMLISDVNRENWEITKKDLLCKWLHFAVHIWRWFFISKYGKYEKFCIWTLEEICSYYPHNYIFCVEKKEHIKSIYEDSINEVLEEEFL